MDKRSYKYIGRNVTRFDVVDKVRGRFPISRTSRSQMPRCSAFRPHANAVVKKIDVSEASRIEGVEILTYLDA